ADTRSRLPSPARPPPAAGAPAASPGNSCHAAASGSPGRCSPPGYPTPAAGNRCGYYAGPGCARRNQRRTPASASALISASANVVTISRSRSGLAWASCSCSQPDTSILDLAAIARLLISRSSVGSLRITRWPSHITTPRTSGGLEHHSHGRNSVEDDLEGGPAEETVQFGLDGAHYEIDLSVKNASVFRKQLAHSSITSAGPGAE